jgi:hypothetical protein
MPRRSRQRLAILVAAISAITLLISTAGCSEKEQGKAILNATNTAVVIATVNNQGIAPNKSAYQRQETFQNKSYVAATITTTNPAFIGATIGCIDDSTHEPVGVPQLAPGKSAPFALATDHKIRGTNVWNVSHGRYHLVIVTAGKNPRTIDTRIKITIKAHRYPWS